MGTDLVFMFAIGVFVLMSIGIFFTMIEFKKITVDPSIRKGTGEP